MKLRLGILTAALLVLAVPVAAQTVQPARVFGLAFSAQGVWFDNDAAAIRSDVEGGLSARASLSPHISLVGAGFYGARAEYFRYAGGVRITATDVKNRDFSVGIGYQYRGSDDERLKPDEWGPDVTLGWRPWPGTFPDLLFNLQSWYGIGSNAAAASAGIRYVFPI